MMVRTAEAVKRLFKGYGLVRDVVIAEENNPGVETHNFYLSPLRAVNGNITGIFIVILNENDKNVPGMKAHYLHCKAIVEALMSLPRI